MTATDSLSARQREILAFLWDYLRREFRMPTVREINAHFGWASFNAPQEHLRALARKGYIERRPGAAARSIRLLGVRVEIEEGGAGDRLREALGGEP